MYFHNKTEVYCDTKPTIIQFLRYGLKVKINIIFNTIANNKYTT